ncbi:MAG: 3-deoxy-manno-octulosonate cytidylyltransferase [Proteobacteria bacterium]|nr:3-deoxy-manno-octulosonate cytidylyltransferase [Pseudomonadota bacterium]
MRIAVVIPARYGSRRYPGKPLMTIRGRSLLNRVWAIAKAVGGVDEVYVATDDERIAAHARSFGAAAVMTRADCATGTDRVREAVARIEPRPDAVVNLQGDAVLTPPWVIRALVDALRAEPSLRLVTAAVHCGPEQYEALLDLKAKSPTSGTLVTFDRRGFALYFSKAVIPYLRIRAAGAPLPVYRHIGIYGYRRDALEELAGLAPTPLEVAEQLEQLRALENGIPIKVVVVDYRGRSHGSVDAPEDVPVIEAIIDREGELVPGR